MKSLRLLLVSILFSQVGCASFGHKLKNFLGGEGEQAKAAPAPKDDATKYSSNPDMPPSARRQYKRTTKESLANESALDQKAGSLWVMEGQGAYLFAQNTMRLIGDPIGVQIEGEPKEQLQAKADVLKDLLGKIEERQAARQRALASQNSDAPPPPAAAPADDKAKDAGSDKKAAGDKKPDAKDFNVKLVPTRITERTVEGNYRVKGSQPFMINGREFKVIVTGVVRAEDFSDDGIAASKLLDPKFDIVSVKRNGAEL